MSDAPDGRINASVVAAPAKKAKAKKAAAPVADPAPAEKPAEQAPA